MHLFITMPQTNEAFGTLDQCLHFKPVSSSDVHQQLLQIAENAAGKDAIKGHVLHDTSQQMVIEYTTAEVHLL
jgi:hypothetical protein